MTETNEEELRREVNEVLAERAASEGRKDDAGKLPYHLLPSDAVEEILKVLEYGATKYAPRNWEKGMAWSRPFSALMLGSKSTKSDSVSLIFSVALKVNTLNIRDVLFFVPGNVMVFDLLPFLALRSLISLILNVNGNGAS